MTDRKFNFNAGPSTLPLPVLEEIARDMVSLPGVGISILELGHRTELFKEMTRQACQRVREIFGLSDEFDVFFLQGGGRLMFSLLPMNFATIGKTPGYLVSGSWGKKAYEEAIRTSQYTNSQSEPFTPVWSDEGNGFRSLPKENEGNFSSDLAFLHYTTNETIQGVQFKRSLRPEVPKEVPIFADMSSDIMSRKIDPHDFDLIYACVQKNLGPAGATLVIAKKSLLENCSDSLPGYCNLKNHSVHQSMYNTPPVFAIYATGLVLKWFQNEFGTLDEIEKVSQQKSQLVYDVMDRYPDLYLGHADREYRSDMNVTFRFQNDSDEVEFLEESKRRNLAAIKGHRSVGGIRASLYNAMPVEGARKLAEFMDEFARSKK